MNFKDTLFEIDDVLGQLSDAIDVVEVLTKGTIANKATGPLMAHLQELQRLVKAVWPEKAA